MCCGYLSALIDWHVNCKTCARCISLILVLRLRGVLCAVMCPLILTLDFCGKPIGDWKTWVDIPDEGQKGVIQDGVQDGRHTLIPNITPSGSVLEWWILCLYLDRTPFSLTVLWCPILHVQIYVFSLGKTMKFAANYHVNSHMVSKQSCLVA